LKLFGALVLLYFLSFSGKISAQIDCSDQSSLKSNFAKLNRLNEGRKTILSELIEGQNSGPFSLQSLFSIDLEKEEEVQLKKEELQTNLRQRHWMPTALKAWENCFQGPKENLELKKYFQATRALTVEVEQLRLKFLSLPQEKRSALYNPEMERHLFIHNAPEISQLVLALSLEQLRTRKELARDDEELITEVGDNLQQYKKVLRDHLSLLETGLWSLHYHLRQKLEYQELQLQMREWQKELLETKKFSEKQLAIFHKQINPRWRKLVEASLVSYKLSPELPFVPLSDSDASTKLRETRAEREELYQKLKADHGSLSEDLLRTHYRLLNEAGIIRSAYIKRLRVETPNRFTMFEGDFFGDLKRELFIIPSHWSGIFLTKLSDLKTQISLGQKGLLTLAKDLLILIFLFVIPILVWKAINLFSQLLDRLREYLMLGAAKNPQYGAGALWIQRLNPFIPWIFSIIGLVIVERSVNDTPFEELSLITPYFKFYFIYKIFRRFIVVTLTQISAIGKLQLSRENRVKINLTAKQLAVFVLWSTIVLHTVESIVSRGLVFFFISISLQVITIMFLFLLAHRWREETAELVETVFRGKIKIPSDQKITSFLLSLPLLIVTLGILVATLLKKWTGEFDFSKRLSAKFFRRKLESAETLRSETEGHGIPDDYRQNFNLDIPEEQFIMHKFKSLHVEDIQAEIDEWLSDSSQEHSLAIYGDRGLGKSTILARVAAQNTSITVLKTSIPPKILNRGQLFRHFGDLLEIDLESGFSQLIEKDKKSEPTLILIDEAHNMFLSKVGGFEAFKAFLELINAQTENTFWCACFSTYSWRYVNSVFGRNHYFRAIKKISPWTEEEISNLIISRHKSSGYQLSYDAILAAAQNLEESVSTDYIEAKFFRLLWEQSGGNPRIAIELWFSALTKQRGLTLRVGLPRLSKKALIYQLSDDAHFVYTEILRHDNLSTREACEVTNLPEGVVRHALKIGLENDFLERNKQDRYRVTTVMQHQVVQALRKKNFIYGN